MERRNQAGSFGLTELRGPCQQLQETQTGREKKAEGGSGEEGTPGVCSGLGARKDRNIKEIEKIGGNTLGDEPLPSFTRRKKK